ncbi:MAG: hypothetical protein Q9222_001984 [Ikaeria aurantiellina]
MEDSAPRKFVFASLYYFSDHEHIQISYNDETTINAFFDTYAGYIKVHKKQLFVLDKTLELDHPLDSSAHESIANNANNYHGSQPVVVQNHIISRVWTLQPKYAGTISPRLPQAITAFEMIALKRQCRITFTKETNTAIVNGANETDVQEIVRQLDQLTDSLYIRMQPPQIYNLLNPEGQTKVHFQLTAITEDEVNFQRSTSQILKSSQCQIPKISELFIIILVQKGKGVVTRPKQNSSSSSNINKINNSNNSYTAKKGNFRRPQGVMDLWQTLEIHPIGRQGKTDLCLREQPTKGSAPQTVEEWIDQMPCRQSDPFQPLKAATREVPASSEGFEIAGPGEVANLPTKKRFAKGRRAPILLGEDSAGVNEIDATPVALDEHVSFQKQFVDMGPQHGISFNSETPSLSSIQKSRSTGLNSATPPTDSLLLEDLLNGAESAIPYPVLIPLPAINGPYVGTPSQAANEPSEVQSTNSQPAWLVYNHTASASTKSKGRPLLINHVGEAPPPPPPRATSYPDAAKHGSIASRSLPQESAGGNLRDRIYEPSDTSRRNRSQKSSDPQSRKPDQLPLERVIASHIGQIASSEDLNPLMIRLLQSAKTLGGKVQVQVNIGRIFVSRHLAIPTGSAKRVALFNDWPSIFNLQGRKTIETLFTDRLPKPLNATRFPASLKQLNGERMFAETPDSRDVKYHLYCYTRSGDEEVILQADKSGDIEVLSTPHEVGAVQLHFPKHQWDARILVNTTEQVRDYQNAADSVRNTLSVIPGSDHHTVDSLTADLGDSGRIFRSGRVLRQICFGSLEDEDISMSCTEVQELGLSKNRRYQGHQKDRKVAEDEGELWWEIKLHSASINSRLDQVVNDSPGLPSPWKAQDVIQGEIIGKLHALAARLIPQLDNLGATIDQSTKAATSAPFVEPRPTSVSKSSDFW